MTFEIKFRPDQKTIKVRSGISLFDAGRKANVMIRSRCGGKASCLMCKVTVVDQSGLTPPSLLEQRKLGSLLDKNQRLSCQAKVIGHCIVDVPEDPLKSAVRRQLAILRGEEEGEDV